MLQIYRALKPYLANKGKMAFIVLLSAIALAVIKFAQAYLVKPIFDKGLNPNGSFEDILWTGLGLLLISLLNIPCRFGHFYYLRKIVEKIICEVREKIFEKFQNLPMKKVSTISQGDSLSYMMNDTISLSVGFQGAVDYIREPITGLFLLGLAIYRDWQLTLVVFCMAPFLIFIFSRTGKETKRHQHGVQDSLGRMAKKIAEGLSGQKTIKAFNLQDYMLKKFSVAQGGYFNSQLKANRVEEITSPLVQLIISMALGGVIIFAHHRISLGAMTSGDFVSFISAIGMLNESIRKFSKSHIKMNQALAAKERIFEVLKYEEENNKGGEKIEKFSHSLDFRNISFSYGNDAVLKNINFSVKKGQKIAFVGESGSGKSTLVNLLVRLYESENGEILIDGKNIKNVSLQDYRNLFSYVSQNSFLFNDSILENISMGHNYSDSSIRKALQLSNSLDFVEETEKSLETKVGDRGVRLSGGQAQRITLARAFLQSSPILIFDEATSALDNESEKIIQQGLDNLDEDKTIIAIAHRLSTVKNFDHIYLLGDGEILEHGRHEELLSLKGGYYHLWNSSKNI